MNVALELSPKAGEQARSSACVVRMLCGDLEFTTSQLPESSAGHGEVTLELARVAALAMYNECIIRMTSRVSQTRVIDVTAADEWCAEPEGDMFYSLTRRLRAGVRITLACPAPASAPTEPPESLALSNTAPCGRGTVRI